MGIIYLLKQRHKIIETNHEKIVETDIRVWKICYSIVSD
jgi:hypothetical protein